MNEQTAIQRARELGLPTTVEEVTHGFEPDIAGLEPHRCKRLDCGLRSATSAHAAQNSATHESGSSRQFEASHRIRLLCIGCNKTPSEIEEYIGIAAEENTTPDDYVWEEEGTLNRRNGHFLCTLCYVSAGCPSSPVGWMAP